MNVDLKEKGDNITEETMSLISSLPSHADAQGKKLCKYQGTWYYFNILQGVVNFQRNFQPQDTDIILASFPKSGTTWLKALTVALFERSKHRSSSDDHHPLLSNNPHGIFSSSSSSPRVFSTHMPLHTMKEALKDSPCKIVYVCRNVKDTLVSLWCFACAHEKTELSRSRLESMFKSFCNGTIFYGPFWEHVLSYWRASMENPSHVLFMRYEEMRSEPRGQVKRLAEFLGCAFTKEEEESGMVDKILDLCSLRNLSGLEVNKSGRINTVDHKIFFRKGEVGDSKNYLTPDMENEIDMIIQEKLQGSGLKY
ncbi:cytosolic sulfotransferase 1 isoform X2 [Eutrema salsugineum]|uniref:cytosolic sulfotransferase 1 isoform X2 n=1 Tax=Eutrema salsugineum TaxID=72664 RepID=UPI000CED0D6E|nr:cytosolic sulfotransferase 1 isoform X2 [Eutrema salsugineum]